MPSACRVPTPSYATLPKENWLRSLLSTRSPCAIHSLAQPLERHQADATQGSRRGGLSRLSHPSFVRRQWTSSGRRLTRLASPHTAYFNTDIRYRRPPMAHVVQSETHPPHRGTPVIPLRVRGVAWMVVAPTRARWAPRAQTAAPGLVEEADPLPSYRLDGSRLSGSRSGHGACWSAAQDYRGRLDGPKTRTASLGERQTSQSGISLPRRMYHLRARTGKYPNTALAMWKRTVPTQVHCMSLWMLQ